VLKFVPLVQCNHQHSGTSVLFIYFYLLFNRTQGTTQNERETDIYNRETAQEERPQAAAAAAQL